MPRHPSVTVYPMSDVIITVRGESQTRVAPERAVAHVSAAADGAERGAVVERIAALAEPVRADLAARKAAGGIADWSSQRVSVWADRPWNSDGRQLDPVHHASVELTATFTDGQPRYSVLSTHSVGPKGAAHELRIRCSAVKLGKLVVVSIEGLNEA